MENRTDLPGSASVVVIGAGLAGLTTARELMGQGVSDVVVVEARDRVGGRLDVFRRENGKTLERGGEFVNPNGSDALIALGAELGLEIETVPTYLSDGKFVRVFDGERFVESIPLESDPEASEAFLAAMAAFDELVSEVPPLEPWGAPRASELDRMTLGDWFDEHVQNDAARDFMFSEFMAMGDPYETSLLYALWHVSGFGGLERTATSERFVDGLSAIPRAIAGELGGRVHLSTPVHAIEQTAEGVAVHTSAGAIGAEAVVVAMEPSQCASIEFTPTLPISRDRLQDRWQGGHGVKIFAIYDRPFWRDRGLSGLGISPNAFIQLALDVSPSDAGEGIICAMHFPSNARAEDYSGLLGDVDGVREATLSALAEFIGDEALEPTEFHYFNWAGDRWSDGCGGQVGTSVVSTVGRRLREPVGRIFWAGAETGDTDFAGGAVTSAQRAAREVLSSLGGAHDPRSAASNALQ